MVDMCSTKYNPSCNYDEGIYEYKQEEPSSNKRIEVFTSGSQFRYNIKRTRLQSKNVILPEYRHIAKVKLVCFPVITVTETSASQVVRPAR